MKPAQNTRTREYPAHPIPRTARSFVHVAAFFHAEGDRQFPPNTTGRALGAELSRSLNASARAGLGL